MFQEKNYLFAIGGQRGGATVATKGQSDCLLGDAEGLIRGGLKDVNVSHKTYLVGGVSSKTTMKKAIHWLVEAGQETEAIPVDRQQRASGYLSVCSPRKDISSASGSGWAQSRETFASKWEGLFVLRWSQYYGPHSLRCLKKTRDTHWNYKQSECLRHLRGSTLTQVKK